jgi:periplasmic protein TonB
VLSPSLARVAPRPFGWVGSCLLHAGIIAAAIFVMRMPLRPPTPWPEAPVTFHVIFEPPSAPAAPAKPSAPAPPKPQPAQPAPPPPAATRPAPPPPELAVPTPAEKPMPPPAPAKPRPRPTAPRELYRPPPTAAPAPTARASASASPVPPGEQKAVGPRALPFVPARPIGYAAGNQPPEYPAAAQQRGFAGRVLLRVDVSVAGTPLDVKVVSSSGHDILDEAALRAVRAWRFVPATRGGTPVAGVVNVPVEFKLAN